MTIETIFSGTRIATTDSQERKRAPADDAAGIERLFLVTVGLVAGLEVGLAALWLMG